MKLSHSLFQFIFILYNVLTISSYMCTVHTSVWFCILLSILNHAFIILLGYMKQWVFTPYQKLKVKAPEHGLHFPPCVWSSWLRCHRPFIHRPLVHCGLSPRGHVQRSHSDEEQRIQLQAERNLAFNKSRGPETAQFCLLSTTAH